MGTEVIGSVYAGRLLDAGHAVELCARGRRLAQLREHGLVLEDAQTGHRRIHHVPVVSIPARGSPCDVVLVAVHRDQMLTTLPLLAGVDADVVFFGNGAGLTAELAAMAGPRAMFGFPAAGGVRDGAVVRFVLIRQQKTMLADTRRSPRMSALAKMFESAGFPVHTTTDAEGWLIAHAAFIVPIAYALYHTDVDPGRLAADSGKLTSVVRATRQAFQALRAAGNAQIPANLRALYLLMPEQFAVRYWRSVLRGPRGELWFAAHTRSAPEEMASLAGALQRAVADRGRAAPDLDALVISWRSHTGDRSARRAADHR